MCPVVRGALVSEPACAPPPLEHLLPASAPRTRPESHSGGSLGGSHVEAILPGNDAAVTNPAGMSPMPSRGCEERHPSPPHGQRGQSPGLQAWRSDRDAVERTMADSEPPRRRGLRENVRRATARRGVTAERFAWASTPRRGQRLALPRFPRGVPGSGVNGRASHRAPGGRLPAHRTGSDWPRQRCCRPPPVGGPGRPSSESATLPRGASRLDVPGVRRLPFPGSAARLVSLPGPPPSRPSPVGGGGPAPAAEAGPGG